MSQKIQSISTIPMIQVGPNEKRKLLSHIPNLFGKKVLVVGDVGLDEYVLGDVRRISPEAPVPVLEVENEDLRLGMAGNVAQNIKSLGGIPILVSVIGSDSGADLLQHLLKTTGVASDFLIKDEDRPTTRKIRIMAKHHHLCRVDRETRRNLTSEVEMKVLKTIENSLSQAEVMIVEDYAKGVLSGSLLQQIIKIAHAMGKKIIVDPHKAHSGHFYSGVDLIKPNFTEALALSGLNYDELHNQPDMIIKIGQALQKITGANEVVITRSEAGMIVFSNEKITQVPTYARKVFDVTGAGDTVIAALTLGLVSGLHLNEACMLANFAAGVVVGQVGCVPCSVQELKAYIEAS